MNYLLLVLEAHGQRTERSLDQGQQAYDQMLADATQLKAEGHLHGVNSLLGDEQGARVQVRQGRTRTADGRFNETKEMIGGYFLVDCPSLADAVALAERCPAAARATVEVRPVGPCWA